MQEYIEHHLFPQNHSNFNKQEWFQSRKPETLNFPK